MVNWSQTDLKRTLCHGQLHIRISCSVIISDYLWYVDYKWSTTAKGPATKAGISHQLGQASFGKDSARTAEMKMSGTPAPHVEPFHSSGRERPILLMEQDKLLLGSDRGVLQHPLQLQHIDTPKEWGCQVFTAIYNRIWYCEIHIYIYIYGHTYIHLTPIPIWICRQLCTLRTIKQDWFRQLHC